MTTESIIASSTHIQTLLIAFVLIVSVIYFFIELRRIDMRMNSLETTVRKVINDMKMLDNNHQETEGLPVTGELPVTDERSTTRAGMVNEDTIQENETTDIENQVESRNEMNNIVENISREVTEEISENSSAMGIFGLTSMNPLEALSKSMNQIEITLTNPVEEIVDDPVEANIEEVVEDVEEVVEDVEDNTEQPLESSVQKEIEDSTNSKDTLLDITQTIIEKETSLDIQENDESEVTSITMDRIDDITDKEGSDEDGNTLDIDDPIPESNSPKPLLTEITAYTEYQNHTIKELKDILTEMQLPTSGNKTKLIQRIVSNKNKISN